MVRVASCSGPSLDKLPLANKPGWLRQRAPQGERFDYLSGSLRSLELHTVCEEAQCPNMGECWDTGTGTATIMLLGAASCNLASLKQA
jgi:lipoic acid synthetase